MCSPAPCKVLNGGSQDEVITVWAVAGHHYDLITHNITTKYNYQTFIIQNWPELCTSQHHVPCHYRTAVLVSLHSAVRTCSCEEARGPPITITRALGWLLVTGPCAGVSTVWTRPVYYVSPWSRSCSLQSWRLNTREASVIILCRVEKLQRSPQCNGLWLHASKLATASLVYHLFAPKLLDSCYILINTW